MAHYFDGSAYLHLTDPDVGLIPAGPWTISGWARGNKWDGISNQILFQVRDPNTGQRVILFYREHSTGGGDYGLYHLQYTTAAGVSTLLHGYDGEIWLKYNLGRWYFLCASYTPGALRFTVYVPERGYKKTFTAGRTFTAQPHSQGVFFGAANDTLATPFYGQLANWSMLDGVDANADDGVYRSLALDGRAYKMPSCRWHVPMLAGRFEEWKQQAPVIGSGVQPSVWQPRLALLTPKSFDLYEYVDPAKYLSAKDTVSVSEGAGVEGVQLLRPTDSLELDQTVGVELVPVNTSDSTLVLDHNVTVVLARSRTCKDTLSILHGTHYVGPKFASAESLLILGDSARVPDVLPRSATDILTLNQSTSVGGTLRLGASSRLTLSDLADNVVKVRKATTQIVLTDSATADKVITVKDTLNLTQAVGLGAMAVSATNTLQLTDEVRWNPKPLAAGDSLTLTQTTWVNMRPVSAGDTLKLSDRNTVLKPIRAAAESTLTTTMLVFDPATTQFVEVVTGLRDTASVAAETQQYRSHVLLFAEQASVTLVKASAITASVTDALTLTQNARLSLTGEATSVLVLTQVAVGHAGRLADVQLELTDAATVIIDRGVAAESSLTLTQAAAYTLVIGSTKSQYSPFVGAGDGPVPPTALQGPVPGIQVPFQLVYPAVGIVTDAVSLKAPNLGNKDRLTFNRISRETRGGTVIVWADPDWPKTQTQVLQFSGLLRVEAQALLTFIDEHLGQEIGMIDWEHRYWRGIITTPDEPVVEDRFDSFTASFQFEGELDPTWNPQVVPPSLRYSAVRSPQKGGYYVPNEPQLPAVPETMDFLTAEADSNVIVGQPVYVKINGHIDLAQAISAPQVVGVTISDKAAATAANYITEGQITRTDWTPITGTVTLSAGVTYFLDTAAGRLTTAAPTAVGQYVVRVGRAVSTTTLDVEIELPILL